MATKGHLLYYPEGKHDILLGKELNDVLKSKIDSITKTTYVDLKDLRDNSKLIPGSLYRITDYQCTTTQENTRSAGHQFDIVLLALSENKLAEEGWAMEHPTDVYDVTFSDGVTKKCYYYRYQSGINRHDVLVYTDTLLGFDYNSGTDDDLDNFINKTNKTINLSSTPITSELLNVPDLTYNYFQNSNLSAWKVWYCLDNDKSRFAWADDSVPQIYSDDDGIWLERDITKDRYNRFAWYNGDDDVTYYTDNMMPKVGEQTYIFTNKWYSGAVVKNVKGFGRGVIYRLIDEWNNDVGYDFKNIQFLVENNWLYTMSNYGSPDDSGNDASVFNDGFVVNNYIRKNINDMEGGEILGGNILIHGMSNSIIGVRSRNNMIIRGNTILIDCVNTRIVDGDSILVGCSDFTPEESGYYLMNKKVLTEE